ncbi:MAG TPA: hypothetical protein VJS92_04515 [Candidatus Polarisedimenticolaceae bacterium]|nr:hypothetical protein [Candidatus Polarisedimenticolaceae bacterium]
MYTSSRSAAFLAVICCAFAAWADDPNVCDAPGESPDVIVGDLQGISSYSPSVGGISAFSIGTYSCNVGTCWLSWNANTSSHPVIAQNMFRLKNNRFEQIGQSWLKHGFYALSTQLCSTGCVGTDGSHLGVNCSDPYDAGLNGEQDGLGPKFEVDSSAGSFPYPFTGAGLTGNSIYKRLQVHNTDLDPAQNAGAQYFIEGQYVTRDDAEPNNDDNNASYRPITISGSGGSFTAALAGTTQRTLPAIRAWKLANPAVVETIVDAPDGRFNVAALATDLGGGLWSYEYAVQNFNSNRSAQAFVVPISDNLPVSNLGFHDVDYHSGEPFDGTDWAPTVSANSVSWATTSYALNVNANALRWGTLYNFRFQAAAPPQAVSGSLVLFRPGTPASVSFATIGPYCGIPAPTLVAPASGAVLTTTTAPTLDWLPVSGATTYEVQVATNSGFTALVRSVAGVTTTSWPVSPPLPNDAGYYWRVRATGSCGGWSAARSFSLGCVAPIGVYDPGRRAPGCVASACGCTSGGGIESRDSIAGGGELNQPNTINNSCADGTTGQYHSTTNGESVDRITVKSTDSLGLRPGHQAQVDVTVWCRGTGAGPMNLGRTTQLRAAPDSVDLYYTSNASSPSWTAIATNLSCPPGAATLTRTFTLANVAGTHAVRAQIRNGGSASACTAGVYNDRDDLTFRVDPLPVEAVSLDAGYGHSVSVNANTQVWSWGLNQSGQLGDGSLTDRNGPVRSGMINDLTNVVAVSGGVSHTVALDGNGRVWTWGGNAHGQIGDGGTVNRVVPYQLPGLTGIVAVAAGMNHTLAVTSTGGVYAWGENTFGQLGNGNPADQRTPVAVAGVSDVVAVAAGFEHSVALDGHGRVWAWGHNQIGQLGNGTHTDRFVPDIVPNLSGVKQVSCGAYFNLARLEDGTVRGWGHNFYGQLGLGNNDEQTTAMPIPDLGDVTAVAAGSGFSLVISGGSVWSFGQNVAGQLGDGAQINRNTPVPVQNLPPTAVAIAGGEDHSLALLANGEIYGWGKNVYGQVGAGSSPQLLPRFITDRTALPVLGLSAPVGGERWEPGSSQVVRWTGAGPVLIEMSLDGSTGWTQIGPPVSFPDAAITVPPWTTGRARLRISRTGPPASSALSGPLGIYHLPARFPWLGLTVDGGGDVAGEFGSIAVDSSGRTWIAYYDRTQGALLVARRLTSGVGEVSWAVENVDSSVAAPSSLAFAHDGQARISYLSASGVARFASRTAAGWQPPIDIATGICASGRGTSLVLDSQDRPYIALEDCFATPRRVRAMTAVNGQWIELYSNAGSSPVLRLVGDRPRLTYLNASAQLRLVAANGSYPFSWSDVLVPGVSGAGFESLAVNAQDDVWISFYTSVSPRKLRLVKRIGGSWNGPADVDAALGDVGNYNSIALDAAGRPRIAYHANGLLRLAEWNGTSWDLDVADGGPDTGTHAALAIDASGNYRVAHFDAANGDLNYSISQPDVTPPTAPVLTSAAGPTTAAVSWSGSGDDGASGQASAFEVRFSNIQLTDANFDVGTPVPAFGHCASVEGLNGCSPYYFAVRALDDLGNASIVSTVYVPTPCSGSLEVTCD